ncbi:hypothetical protein Fmac_025255 [Flemingia macrophylla]|uniref:Uncharacterized protein n=1 Tax=Flemingia macrophylla TaxID=520843 RepID=A0ABD1LRQ8_9FABA
MSHPQVLPESRFPYLGLRKSHLHGSTLTPSVEPPPSWPLRVAPPRLHPESCVHPQGLPVDNSTAPSPEIYGSPIPIPLTLSLPSNRPPLRMKTITEMATAPTKAFLSLMVPCFRCRLRWSRRKVTLFMSGVGSLLAKFIAVGSKRLGLRIGIGKA